MNEKHAEHGSESAWHRIPGARRDFYVYTLLLLTALVGNRSYDINSIPEREDLEIARAEVARFEGMKQNTLSLYQ